MEIKINMGLSDFTNLCPRCLGSGKLKAMQSAMTYGGKSARATDTTVKCNLCNGKGFIKE